MKKITDKKVSADDMTAQVNQLELEKAYVTDLAMGIVALSDCAYSLFDNDRATAMATLGRIIVGINDGTFDVSKL